MKYAVCAQKVLEDRIPDTEKRKEERRYNAVYRARKREVKADKEKWRKDRQV